MVSLWTDGDRSPWVSRRLVPPTRFFCAAAAPSDRSVANRLIRQSEPPDRSVRADASVSRRIEVASVPSLPRADAQARRLPRAGPRDAVRRGRRRRRRGALPAPRGGAARQRVYYAVKANPARPSSNASSRWDRRSTSPARPRSTPASPPAPRRRHLVRQHDQEASRHRRTPPRCGVRRFTVDCAAELDKVARRRARARRSACGSSTTAVVPTGRCRASSAATATDVERAARARPARPGSSAACRSTSARSSATSRMGRHARRRRAASFERARTAGGDAVVPQPRRRVPGTYRDARRRRSSAYGGAVNAGAGDWFPDGSPR